MSIKRIILLCLIAIIALGSFGCANNDQEEAKELSKKEIVMIYNALDGAFVQNLDYYEAVNNKKVSKFDFRIIAESARAQSKRVIEAGKSSEDPVVKKLVVIAGDIISFTDELQAKVDHGTEMDNSNQEKIQADLDELRPEIEKIKEEVISQQKK